MSKLTDLQIRSWIKTGERFAGRSDGKGLYLCYRPDSAVPVWRFRYRFAGKQRVMVLASYSALSLASARDKAKELNARVELGYDVAGEKQERKRDALAKIEAQKNAVTVAQLADKYFERYILGRWKHPNIVRSRIERDIKPNIGKLLVEDVKPLHVDAMLQTIVKRCAPTVANDVLRWTRLIFRHAVKLRMIEHNPAAEFDPSDAGGTQKPRERNLSREELVLLFEAMRNTQGFSYENRVTVKLLLLLAVRKSELTGARQREFDLEEGVWHLPSERTKTGNALDIPLPPQAVDALRELHRLASGSQWLLPARKMQERMLPHIHENTLNVALSKIKPLMRGVPPFCIHDFRRTARTHLARLGIADHIAERCLNHKITGVQGIYNRHAYFEERKHALGVWASFLEQCEKGKDSNVIALKPTPKQRKVI